MEKVKGVYKRKDGRYQARYKKGIGPDGRSIFGVVYGKTAEEVIEKRRAIVGDAVNPYHPATELNLIILGAGSHGKDVYEIAESLHIFRKIAFLDDKAEGENILGKCREALRFRGDYPCAIVAIGDNKKRSKLTRFLKDSNFLIPSIISPLAVLSKNATVGEGCVIMPQANIGAAEIGDGCIIGSNASISSDTTLRHYARIDTGAIVPKGAKVKELSHLKAGEIYKNRKVSEEKTEEQEEYAGEAI